MFIEILIPDFFRTKKFREKKINFSISCKLFKNILKIKIDKPYNSESNDACSFSKNSNADNSNNCLKNFFKQLFRSVTLTNCQFSPPVVINFFDLSILIIGLMGYYFEYYLLTLYTIVHFFILFVRCLSSNFKTKLENFKKDQITIKNHYLEDFKIFYYLVFVIRLITFLFYFYFFSLDVNNMNNFADLFYGITYIFILAGLIDLSIILYIIFYKNNT
jgi:hypothetical protein